VPRHGQIPSAEDVLRAVVALADDGFCRRRELRSRFPKLGERELRQAAKRAVAAGLVLERRDREGVSHLAASSEGWSLLRGTTERPSPARFPGRGAGY